MRSPSFYKMEESDASYKNLEQRKGSERNARQTADDLITSNDNETSSHEEGPKRHTACETCRRRKLKCSGNKPKCESCLRLGKECNYTTIHRKSGPPRGYLRTLENRLEQMEKILAATVTAKANDQQSEVQGSQKAPLYGTCGTKRANDADDTVKSHKRLNAIQPFLSETADFLPTLPPVSFDNSKNSVTGNSPSLPPVDNIYTANNSLMHMGIDEPYPTDAVIQQLTEQYFETSHPFYPFLCRQRFYFNLSTGRLKPYLLYAVLMTGASLSDNQLVRLKEQFYDRAAKYLYKAELKSFGEEILTLDYLQTLILMGIHDNRAGCFGRAWLTVGKATRAAHLCNMHDIEELRKSDLSSEEFNFSDPLAMEERRRTFWCLYVLDKYCALGCGWPASLRENEIRTNVPLDDAAFDRCLAGNAASLQDIAENPRRYINGTDSVLAVTVIFAYFLCEAFALIVKPSQQDDSSPTGKWWSAEQQLATLVASFGSVLPKVAVDDYSLANDMAVRLQLYFHVTILAINRAALIKLKDGQGPFKPYEFRIRYQQSTVNIAKVLRMSSNLTKMGMRCPCGIFCLYTTVRSVIATMNEERDVQVFNISRPETNREEPPLLLRPQLDLFMRVLKVLGARVFMAECFYQKLLTELKTGNALKSQVSRNIEYVPIQPLVSGCDLVKGYRHPQMSFMSEVPSLCHATSPDSMTPTSVSSSNLYADDQTAGVAAQDELLTTYVRNPPVETEPKQTPVDYNKTPIFDASPISSTSSASTFQTPPDNNTPLLATGLPSHQSTTITNSPGMYNNAYANSASSTEVKTGELDFLISGNDFLQWNSELMLDDMIDRIN